MILLAALIAAGASAGPVFPVGLEEVHVALSVRDPKGKPVTALSASDFEVTEDGRPQAIQLFARGIDEGQDSAAAREALALDLGLLLDTSSSMLKELKLSQEAASRFLEAIPRARELYTIFFDEDIRVSRYDSENQQGLFDRIHAAKGGGNTALYDAIAVYLSRVQDGTGRKVLVLFTDGEDTQSALAFTDVLKLVRSGRVTIYPIAFGMYGGGTARTLRPRAVLEQLATMTGGQVFTPRSSRDLAGIYDRILEDLAAQFVVGYVSDNPVRDGRFRKIKVTVKVPGLTVRHRTGYTPRMDEVSGESAPRPVDFTRDISPIVGRCQPCHFPGGKMYAALPFDRAATIRLLGPKLFTRIKAADEQALIRLFLTQPD